MSDDRIRFDAVDMPDDFVLECLNAEGEWIDVGRYRASDFGRTDDGAYICAGSGSPLFLRCLRQDGVVLYVVDGQGQPFTYRLHRFPSDQYQELAP